MGGTKTASETVTAGAQQILERAARHHIQVIHIEPGSRLTLVRYRRGGVLYVANKLPSAAAKRLVDFFKSKAKLDLEQAAAPQTGRFELKLGQQAYEIEVDTMPVLHGEKITLGLSETPKTAMSLEELGWWGPALGELKRALAWPRGLIVFGGQSVGGLNLTLAALVKTLQSPALKIAVVAVGRLPLPPSVKQVAVKPELGFSEARQLSIISKDNIDVFGLSLINNAETGQVVGQLAGHHLGLAGVLAAGASQALASLWHFKVEPLNLKPLPLCLGQAFVRRLCEHCRETYVPGALENKQLAIVFSTDQAGTMKRLHELERAAVNEALGESLPLGSSSKAILRLYKARLHGCEQCDHTGYSREIGLFEVLKPGVQTQKALLARDRISRLDQAAIQDGMTSLSVDGLIKALRGYIDLQTLMAAISASFVSKI